MSHISLSNGQNKKMLFTAVFLHKLKEFFSKEGKESWFVFVQSVVADNGKIYITTRKPALNSWLMSKNSMLQKVCIDTCTILSIPCPENITVVFR